MEKMEDNQTKSMQEGNYSGGSSLSQDDEMVSEQKNEK